MDQNKTQTQKKPLKTYGYYIITEKNTIVDWDSDFYCAVRYANAKADVFGKTYYIYNCKYKKVVKACSGWGNSGCYRFGKW